MRERLTAIATPTIWVTLEINQLDDAAVEAALKAHPAAARWTPWLRRTRAMKPHELSEELETFLAERGPISAQWPRLFDETLAAMKVRAGKDELTLAEALNRLSDPKGANRKAAAEGLNAALGARGLDHGAGAEHRRRRQGAGRQMAWLQTARRWPAPVERGAWRVGGRDGPRPWPPPIPACRTATMR